MTVFYLDTSALVKRYKTEEGTDIIDYLYDNLPKGHSLATSFLTVPAKLADRDCHNGRYAMRSFKMVEGGLK